MTDDRVINALRDMKKLNAGWRPSEADIGESVAYIDDWLLVRDDGAHASLHGVVTAHDRIKDGRRTWTSVVVWIDAEVRLARTISRWYRLGEPSARQAAREDMARMEVETPQMKM